MAKAFLAIFLGLLAGLLSLEIAVRILHWDEPLRSQSLEPRSQTQALQAQRPFWFVFPPGANFLHKTAEFQVPVRINAMGLRGPELTYEKNPSEFRILLLGPSWAFGWGVKEEESLPVLLQQDLRRRFPQKNIRVINTGLPAQWLSTNLLYYLAEGHKFHPDLVIQMQSHDLSVQAYEDSQRWAAFRPASADTFFVSLITRTAEHPALKHTALPFAFLQALRRLPLVRQWVEQYIDLRAYSSAHENAPVFEQTLAKNILLFLKFLSHLDTRMIRSALLFSEAPQDNEVAAPTTIQKLREDIFVNMLNFSQHFADQLAKEKIAFLYFNFDGHALFSGKAAQKDQELARLFKVALAQQKFSSLSLDDYLFKTRGLSYGHPKVRELFFPIDNHPNAQGHRLMAQLLANKVATQFLK